MLWYAAFLLVSSTLPELTVLLSLRFSIPRATPALAHPFQEFRRLTFTVNRTRRFMLSRSPPGQRGAPGSTLGGDRAANV